MIQRRRAIGVKKKSLQIDDGTPKMEDCLRQIEGKFDFFRGFSDDRHRKGPYRETGNPGNMTLNFSAWFCYKRKRKQKYSPNGLLTRLKQ